MVCVGLVLSLTNGSILANEATESDSSRQSPPAPILELWQACLTERQRTFYWTWIWGGCKLASGRWTQKEHAWEWSHQREGRVERRKVDHWLNHLNTCILPCLILTPALLNVRFYISLLFLHTFFFWSLAFQSSNITQIPNPGEGPSHYAMRSGGWKVESVTDSTHCLLDEQPQPASHVWPG